MVSEHGHPPFRTSVLLLLLSIFPSECKAQEWPFYGGDAGGSKYSALKQINKQNVTQLKVAWTYHTGEISDGSTIAVRTAFECTPLVVDGVLYLDDSVRARRGAGG